MSQKCVLSIQSHVIHGYVGNKCATFPLQVLGFDVDPVNTVHFSNHTGYPTFKGERLAGDQLTSLLEALTENRLVGHSHLLTGYIGNPSTLKAVVEVLKTLKQQNPACVYLCDPVLGDNGKLYVPHESVEIYRDQVVEHANIVTPNQFEAETLSGISIKSLADACRVADWFHGKGVQKVVISSVVFPDDDTYRGLLVLLGSTQGTAEGAPSRFTIEIPTVEGYFTGTGDCLSALILGWSEFSGPCEGNLACACEKAVATTQAILRRTIDHSQASLGSDAQVGITREPRVVAARELQLVQSKCDIENPPVALKAKPLH